MKRIMLKSKLHNATITQAELFYMGSITIDSNLLDQADILENERVQVVNLNNGARLETYVIRGEAGSGMICMNGPAARLCSEGDRVHIISYASMNEKESKTFSPRILICNDKNVVLETK